jgi:hypothetical protein
MVVEWDFLEPAPRRVENENTRVRLGMKLLSTQIYPLASERDSTLAGGDIGRRRINASWMHIRDDTYDAKAESRP